jgi:hypothetical protein
MTLQSIYLHKVTTVGLFELIINDAAEASGRRRDLQSKIFNIRVP